YAEALTQKDFRTVQFLDWFVKEQGEEEKNADELIQNFRLFGKDGKGLFMLDRELGARTYTATTIDMI
ncbi:MAG: ferritin-like domain-containing protein, partial [Saccharofermentanales bacterium]